MIPVQLRCGFVARQRSSGQAGRNQFVTQQASVVACRRNALPMASLMEGTFDGDAENSRKRTTFKTTKTPSG
jgi:hypothetical protein